MENKNEMTKPLWMQMIGRLQRVHIHEDIEHLLATNKIFIEEYSEVKKKNFDELKDILSRQFKYRKTYSEGIEEEDRDRRYIPLNTKILKGDYFFPEELCNLKNKYMDNEKLRQSLVMSDKIGRIRSEISRVKDCHQASSLSFMYGSNPERIDAAYINFKSLKKQILTAMTKELNRLEKEFAKL